MKATNVGDSPSGKALGSGPSIRGFESLIPSQMLRMKNDAKPSAVFGCLPEDKPVNEL